MSNLGKIRFFMKRFRGIFFTFLVLLSKPFWMAGWALTFISKYFRTFLKIQRLTSRPTFSHNSYNHFLVIKTLLGLSCVDKKPFQNMKYLQIFSPVFSRNFIFTSYFYENTSNLLKLSGFEEKM